MIVGDVILQGCCACQWQNFRTADCQVCGLDWACRRWKFEASFVRRMVFVGPASDVFSCQSARLVAWLGLPRTYFGASFVRLMVFAGPAWACYRHNFGLPVCDSSGLCWACRCHGRNVLLVFSLSCSMSKIRWLCWPHRLALVGLFCAVPSFSGSDIRVASPYRCTCSKRAWGGKKKKKKKTWRLHHIGAPASFFHSTIVQKKKNPLSPPVFEANANGTPICMTAGLMG